MQQPLVIWKQLVGLTMKCALWFQLSAPVCLALSSGFFFLICLICQNPFPTPKIFVSGDRFTRSSSLFSLGGKLWKLYVLHQPHRSPCLDVSCAFTSASVVAFYVVLNDAMGQKKSKKLQDVCSWRKDVPGLLRTSVHFKHFRLTLELQMFKVFW